MTIERIERIRQRAYELWIAEGRRESRDIEYWLRAEREIEDAAAAPTEAEGGAANEGEGNRTAAREFDRAQTAFARREDVGAKARAAEDALEGPEGEALRKAEVAGKARSHGEDLALSGAESGAAKPRRTRAKPAKK